MNLLEEIAEDHAREQGFCPEEYDTLHLCPACEGDGYGGDDATLIKCYACEGTGIYWWYR